jgi:hypothetical protein
VQIAAHLVRGESTELDAVIPFPLHLRNTLSEDTLVPKASLAPGQHKPKAGG